jgi:hypothetical protein
MTQPGTRYIRCTTDDTVVLRLDDGQSEGGGVLGKYCTTAQVATEGKLKELSLHQKNVATNTK